MDKRPSPPRLVVRFFNWFCNPNLLPYIEGDLFELYNQRVATVGERKADLYFILDVILLFRPGIIRSPHIDYRYNDLAIFRNYFKVGLRNIAKHKTFSFINVFGLALAMSVSMLIILMLNDQLSYDKFHSNDESLYRIISNSTYATSPEPLASALKEEYSIVQDATHLTPGIGGDARYNTNLVDMRGYFTSPSFFRVLGFDLERGNKESALAKPGSMVITKEMASLLFGEDNPLGKTIEFDDRQLPFPQQHSGIGSPAVSWGSFTVTGVIDEKKYKSHISFDVLISESSLPALYAEKKVEDRSEGWEWYFRTYTFVSLKPDKKEEDLNAALHDLVTRKYKEIKADHVKDFKLHAQNINDIQLSLNGNDTNTRLPLFIYYFLGGLALIIMLSACLNYTNLSVARALTRAKEIGVRKVTGATRKTLVFQFLSESLLTAFFALTLSLLIVMFLKKAFLNLWINRHLNFELEETPQVYLYFLVTTIVIGLIAGLYPALRLSSYKPVKALKVINDVQTGKFRMFKVLSVTQFVLSLFFITTSILIYNQFQHFLSFDYGFRSDNIVNVELQGVEYQKLANEFRTIPGVITISGSDLIPATGTNNGSQYKLAGTADEEFKFLSVLNTDENYIDNLGLELIAGKNLPADHSSVSNAVVINESAVKAFGFSHATEAIGQTLEDKWSDQPLQIIGVVKNFSYMMPINQHEIGAMLLQHRPSSFQYANVRIAGNNTRPVIEGMEKKWKAIDPLHSFKYRFFDDELKTTHQAILDVVSILGFIALLSIVISCLGLLGMATYTAERKRKEVGIRKILGAANLRIAFLLSKAFLKMLLISICIGAPMSYLINNFWLQMLPNRVEFGFGTLMIAVVVLFTVGIVTIASQTIKASVTNPVDVLKSE